MDKSLTAKQVFEFAGKTQPIYLFENLKNFTSIDQVFDGYNSVLVLYLNQPTSGHWVCLNRIKNGYTYDYHFMDSYGIVIDNERFAIPEKFRIESEQDTPYILQLLSEKENSEIHYNDYQMQKADSKVCGRYCAMFIRFNHLTVEQFVDMIKNESKQLDMSCDEYIYYMSELSILR
jgi:hypothetical protein